MSFQIKRSEPRDDRLSWFRRAWFLAFSLLGCFLLYQASPWAQSGKDETQRVETKTVGAQVQSGPITRKIENVRVGQRLWSDNPEVDTPNETAVAPAMWKLLRLRAEEVWDDGTVDDINVVTLQPPEWLTAHEAEVGAMVALPLDLVEMGLPDNLMAKVLAIERCPTLEDGPGRVVLTTVNHLNRDVYTLTVRDSSGQRTTLYPTGLHKLYRDREWTSVKDLDAGDHIDAFGTPVAVLSVTPKPGTHRVYNLTVESEHVYHVSQLGLLAHNNGCRRVFHGTDEASAASIAQGGLDPKKWRQAAGGAGPDPKGFSVTTDPDVAKAWAKTRAAERGGKPVILEAPIDDLPLKTGKPGDWTDPDELFIDIDDFDQVGGGVFRELSE